MSSGFDDELDEALADGGKPAKKKKKDKKKDKKKPAPAKSASTLLIELALDRYSLGCTEGGQSFAVKPGSHVVRMLRGGKNSLRAELSQAYYWRYGKAAPQQALADALLALEGEAQSRNASPVHLRVASADGAIWVDLGDVAETVVKIDRVGWRIVTSDVPVLFQRTALTGVMPEPKSADQSDLIHASPSLRLVSKKEGGQYRDAPISSPPGPTSPQALDLLWEHVSVAEEDRPLVLGCMIAAIATPDVPHPVLALFGEQGTGKSTASKRIVELTDASPVLLRKPPKDAESWVTAAQGSWVVGLDNLSQVPDWLSDCICRAVTGEGDVRRALYTDGGLAVFAFRRCIVLNGIDVGALRGDLADRTVHVSVDPITEEGRVEEKALEAHWRQVYPLILGALLDDVAEVLRILPSLELASKPRMADFALVLAAVDQLHGTDGLNRYAEQAREMAEDSLSADPFLARMHEVEIDFTGKAAELLAKITPDQDGWRPPKDWPTGPRVVTTLLRRNAPALRKAGWVVKEKPDNDHFIVWTLRHPKIAANPPQSTDQRTSRTRNPGISTLGGCQVPTWRVCKNPNCRMFGACVLADADTTDDHE